MSFVERSKRLKVCKKHLRKALNKAASAQRAMLTKLGAKEGCNGRVDNSKKCSHKNDSHS